MVFLGSSGSEAMEAALKVAEQAQGPQRSKILYAENSFHGKTKGALAITDGPLYRSSFDLSSNNVKVPFGDIEAIRRALESDKSIGIVCLETIQGGGGINSAPPAFWQELRRAVRQARRCCGSPTRCSVVSAGPGGSTPSSTRAWFPTSRRWPSRSAAANARWRR